MPAPQAAKQQSLNLRHSGYVFAALGSLLFATKGIFAKLAYAAGPVDVETLLALRMSLALPAFLIVGARLLYREPERRQHLTTPLLSKIFLIGALGYYISAWLDFSGLQYLTAQLERLILFTYPLFVVVFGALFFKQHFSLWAIPAFLISYSGLALIFAHDTQTTSQDLWKGGLLVLGCAITFAFYQLLAKQEISRIGSRLFTSIAMSSAAIWTIAHFMLTHHWQDLLVSSEVFIYIALIAVISTVLPAFLINEGLNRISPQEVGMIGNLGPIFTTILAVFILEESFGWTEAFGTCLVLGGIILFTRMQNS